MPRSISKRRKMKKKKNRLEGWWKGKTYIFICKKSEIENNDSNYATILSPENGIWKTWIMNATKWGMRKMSLESRWIRNRSNLLFNLGEKCYDADGDGNENLRDFKKMIARAQNHKGRFIINQKTSMKVTIGWRSLTSIGSWNCGYGKWSLVCIRRRPGTS